MIIDINPILKGEKTQLAIDYLLETEEQIEDILDEMFPVDDNMGITKKNNI